MNQTVNTVDDFCECTKGHQLHDFNGSNIADLISIGEHFPGICIRIFVSERDSSLFLIESENINIHFIADVQYFGRLLYALPAEFGNMNHAVDAADIDECTVRSHALDSAVIFLTFFNVVPDCFSSSFALALQYSANGTDNTFAALVYFRDNETYGGTDHSAQICFSGLTGLRCRYEYPCTLDVNNDTALVNFGYIAFYDFTGFLSGLDNSPALGGIQTTFGQGYGSFYVINTCNDCFNGIANFDNIVDVVAVVGKFRCRNKSGILDAKININIHRSNGSNYARYQVAVANGLEGLFQHFIEGKFLLACRLFHNLCCGFFHSLGSFFHSFFCNRSFHCFLSSNHFFFCDFFYCFLCHWDLFSFDLFTHRIYYLLDYPRGCRRSSCDSDSFGSC